MASSHRRKVAKGVTSLLRRFSHEFDADEALQKMKGGQCWQTKKEQFRKRDGTIMSDEEIKDYWNFRRLVSKSLGVSLHAEIELYLKGSVSQGPRSREFHQFLAFQEDVLGRLQVWRTEALLSHYGLRLCGIVDLLCRDETGRIVILDWKRSDRMAFSNRFRCMKPPLGHLDDCSFNLYSLQLNMYRYILESEYKEEVSGMRLVQLHPQLQSYVTQEVHRMDREVDAIVAHVQEFGHEFDSAHEAPQAAFQPEEFEEFVVAQ
mmetsp:Transcript_21316/g.38973  ORF Transcript_21316/g.38973 Transcript_21316/m.38973 type:complete len:262 (+) Transcript_21316:178-963(+)